MNNDRENQAQNQTPQCHQEHGAKGHHHHMLMMIVACMIPVLFIILAPKFGISANLSWLFLLLCPLMHGLMMIPMMFQKKEDK